MWVLKGIRERFSFDVYTHLENVLEVLNNHGVPATFFITGGTAVKHPMIPRRICKFGHEIASHGFSHKSLSRVSLAEAEDDISKSVRALENFQKVRGFRAPFLVRNKATYLACERLGFTYDSSEHGLSRYRPKDYQVTVLPVIYPLDTHGLDIMRLRAKDLARKWLIQCSRAKAAAVCMHVWRLGRKKYLKALLEPLLTSELSFARARDLMDKNGIALTFDIEYTNFRESLPHNFSLLRSPGWQHPKGLAAHAILDNTNISS